MVDVNEFEALVIAVNELTEKVEELETTIEANKNKLIDAKMEINKLQGKKVSEFRPAMRSKK